MFQCTWFGKHIHWHAEVLVESLTWAHFFPWWLVFGCCCVPVFLLSSLCTYMYVFVDRVLCIPVSIILRVWKKGSCCLCCVPAWQICYIFVFHAEFFWWGKEKVCGTAFMWACTRMHYTRVRGSGPCPPLLLRNCFLTMYFVRSAQEEIFCYWQYIESTYRELSYRL